MIVAVCWKEWREQRFFGALLTIVGVALLYTVGLLADGGFGSRDAIAFQRITVLVMAVTIGVVCGAMLLAGEIENGTQWFLDLLPTSRWQLWRAKVIFGIGFTLVQCSILVLAAWVAGAFPQAVLPWALLMVGTGLLAFLAGVCGSAITRTVLAGAGYGLFMFTVCWIVAYLMTIPFIETGNGAIWGLLGIVVSTLPLVWTTWVYTRPDRERRSAVEFWESSRQPLRWGVGVMFWLVYRQSRGLFLILSLLAIAFGCGLLPLRGFTIFGWMVSTGVIAILWGVTVFADEQRLGSHRFWGERRLPTLRLWSVKVGLHFLGLIVGCILMCLPLVLRIIFEDLDRYQQPRGTTGVAEAFRSVMLDILSRDALPLLWLAPLYAFAVGQLAGILFHKPLVAAVVTLLAAGPMIAVWVPSLILGGIHTWQLLLPPVALLFTGRWLMHRWASERLASRRGITISVGGVLASLLFLAAGLAYRAIEMPDVPDALVDSGFDQRLPTVDANEGGRLVKQSCEVFDRIQSPAMEDNRAVPEVIYSMLVRGWSDDDATFNAALARYFASPDWLTTLREASTKSLGVVEDPRLTTTLSPYRTFDTLRTMMPVMAARGLQEQSAGDPSAFPVWLDLGLKTLRQFRNQAPPIGMMVLPRLEATWTLATERWLDRLVGRRDLIEQVQQTWQAYIDEPFDWDESRWAQLSMERTTLNQPQSWLNPQMIGPVRFVDPNEPLTSLVTFAWNVPWERVRRDRQIRLLSHGLHPTASYDPTQISPWLRIVMSFHPLTVNDETKLRSETQTRAVLILLALCRYQSENGRAAESLEALVPKYLPSIPIDPYSKNPFRYRVSDGTDCVFTEIYVESEASAVPGIAPGEGEPAGMAMPMGLSSEGGESMMFMGQAEEMRFPQRPDRLIVPLRVGQGVLWSVGPDGTDHGGRRQWLEGNRGTIGEDWFWVVPAPRPGK